jgi:hypothetical protein
MLENLKLLLGIETSDTDRDALLRLIVENVTKRLKSLLGGVEPPDELSHIILEVSVIRYNRLGSEGLSSHSVEGESLSFTEDDFANYESEIQTYLNSLKNSSKGRVKFI